MHSPPICDECGQPFASDRRHPCTMTDPELHAYALGLFAKHWYGEGIRGAADLAAAVTFAKTNLALGSYGPHLPWVVSDGQGVAFARDIHGPTTTIPWRVVCATLRGERPAAMQTRLFDLSDNASAFG